MSRTGEVDVLRIRMLGAFEVLDDGRPVQLGGDRVRNLLAVLALNPGQPVAAADLLDRCWGEGVSGDARGSLHVAVRRLRRALGASTIGTSDYGYYLDLPPDDVDAVAFADLLTPVPTGEAVETALALWRGEPFGDGFCDWLNRHERPRLVELYLSAVERRAELRLADGRAAESLPELFELTSRHPLRESLWASLMTALDAAGRSAEAIDLYGVIRARLADELGIEPGPELRGVFERVLAAERPAGPVSAGPASRPVAAAEQLPSDLAGFVGQDEVLAELDAALVADLGEREPIRTVVLHGQGGIGKTTTAVRWGHRVADRFPDGQLFVDLHGYGPGEPMDPAVALEVLLTGLGLPLDAIPSGLDARSALLRSTLAGRSVLLVLDNARSEEQVRPLLPGGGSMVVVTSRSLLRGLATREAARSVPVAHLSSDSARRLLRARMRAEVSDDGLLDLLADRCNHLPLALAVAADHVQRRGVAELPVVVQELEDFSDRFDLLEVGDASSDLRTVLSWSVEALDEQSRQLFLLLGLCPAPLFGNGVAAALLGTPVAATRRILRRLVDVHLLEESSGLFRFHDLLRAYAAELVAGSVSASDRWAAEERLLDWYLQTAIAARSALVEEVRFQPDRLDGVEPLTFADGSAAADWFASEGRFLTAAVRAGEAAGHHRLTAFLAVQLWTDLRSRGAVDDATTVQQIAISAAQQADLPEVEVVARNQIAGTLASAGDLTGSDEQLTVAMEICARTGDHEGEAMARSNLATLKQLQGQHDAALGLSLRSVAAHRERGETLWMLFALNAAAVSQVHCGQLDEAIETADEALRVGEKLGDLVQVAVSLNALGEAHSLLGDLQAAVGYFERSATVALQGRSYVQAIDVLTDLGKAYRRAGDLVSARKAWGRAENLLPLLAPGTSPAVAERLRELVADS
ncbi:BTAD domain-containing putative transcriptional regulator [Kribbella sp. NPDC051586]|uniref:AfsR/SARP family transcriptional regulator n=1 Tax=Kribbella sp. NPDC051586 TaxID=3364118 RepID=UPI0037B920AF